MLNLISAEWRKLLPHKGTWLLVWIYPVLLLVILTIALLAEGAGGQQSAQSWMEDSGAIWYVPTITLGRYLIAAYFALVFAGEYGWNTWKLVVPHAPRWKLIGAKYLVATALLYLAWIAAAMISLALMLIDAAATGEAIPKGVTALGVLETHYTMIKMGIAPMLIAALYASLAAVVTRSTLASLIISLVLITIDELYGHLCAWISAFGIEWPSLLYRVLPGYHLDNMSRFLERGVPARIELATGTVIEYSFMTSYLALTVWVVGLAAATLWVFRRQDIN